MNHGLAAAFFPKKLSRLSTASVQKDHIPVCGHFWCKEIILLPGP